MKRAPLVLAFVAMALTVLLAPATARADGWNGSPTTTAPSSPSTTVSAPDTAPGAKTPAADAEPDDEIAPPTPEKLAEIEARSQAYLEEVRQARATKAAAGMGSTQGFGGTEAIETPDYMPWLGTQQTWCTYGNPGSPGGYCANYHTYPALDIGMPVGTTIVAAGSGKVVDISTGCSPGNTGCGGGAGNYVSIMHVDSAMNTRYTRYMHLSSVQVSVNQTVTKGQTIGLSGWTGNVSPLNATAAHLHYEEDLARYGSSTDPGEMYSCVGSATVAALGSRGLANWKQMPWGTMLQNDNANCVGLDADNDGVIDGIDNCPNVPGPVGTDGCDVDQTSAQRTSADFNNDGRGDVVYVYGPNAAGSKIMISYGQAGGGLSYPATVWDSGAFGWEWNRIKLAAGDFTHDGFDDLVLFYSVDGGGTLMFISYGSSGGLMAPTLMWNSGAGGFDLTKAKVTAGDYNGDGYADVGLLAAGANNQVTFLIGMGTAGGIGVPTGTWTSAVGAFDGSRARVVGGDFDGDGRGDVGLFAQVDPTRAQLWIAPGRAGITMEPTISPFQLVWDSGSGGWDAERTKVTAADYDGDGRSDFGLLRGYDGKRTTLSVAYAIGVGVSPPTQVWDSGSGNSDWQYIRVASCDTGATGRARIGLLTSGADNVTRFSFTNADGAGGWVAPQQQWMAEGFVGARTQMVGCDLQLPVSTSKFHALPPARLLDSRDGTGGSSTPWGPGESRDVTVLGAAGIPTTGVSSVVLNVTVTGASDPSFLTVWSTGLARPLLSNLNYTSGQTVANQVIVKVGAGGKISIFNNSGNVHVIADVLGFYDGGTGDAYNPVVPARVLDSRNNTGGYGTPWGPATSRDVQVTGVGGVPATGVSAVLVNLTATNTTTDSHLTVWPSGQAKPTASVLNFGPGRTVPNLVLATVGAGGKISIFNNAGSVDILADVVGWFGPASGSTYSALAGSRILDSRFGIGGYDTPWGAGESRDVLVTEVGGVPNSGVTAVVLNLTVTGPTDGSHVTAWPAGQAQPTASNLNFVGGQTVPNLVVVKVGAGGKVSLFNNAGSVHLIADVVGYYH